MENKRRLIYGKSDGDIIPHEPSEQVDIIEYQQSSSDSVVFDKPLPSVYTKHEGMLSDEIICVISGGTVREKALLNELSCKKTFKCLEVIFVSTPKGMGGLTPRMMNDRYSEMCKDGVIHLTGRDVILDSVDSVYMFTDMDHYRSELVDILANIKENQNAPIWIISNPDIEIWIYYCFRNTPDEDLKEVVNASDSERSSLLKTVNGKFNKGGGLDPRKTFEHLDVGIKNSESHYVEDENGLPMLLSTQMHLFAKDVINKLGNEYEAWLAHKAAMKNIKP